MGYKDLYTIEPKGPNKDNNPTWYVGKIDKDGLPGSAHPNAPSGYLVSKPGNYYECPCFASNRHTCRHRDMVRMYENDAEFRQKIDDHWLYNYDKDKWQAPVKVEEV